MRYLIKYMNDQKVRYKLILVYVITGILPMLILFSISYSQLKIVMTKNEVENLKGSLGQATSSLETQLKIYNNLMDYLAYNQTISEIVSIDDEKSYDMYKRIVTELDPMVATVKFLHDAISQLTIYLNGDVTAHDNTLRSYNQIENEEWAFKAMRYNLLCYWYIDRTENKAFSVRKMPLVKTYGGGLLYLSVDYNKLFQSFDNLEMDNCGIFISDSYGNMIYENSMFDQEKRKFQMSFFEFQKEKNNDNSDYEILKIISDQTGWTVWMYKPKALIMNMLQPMIVVVVGVFLLCMMVSLASIIWFSNFIAYRILKLKNSMIEVENGNLDVTMISHEKDEIGDLIRGYTKMLIRIRMLISEVYESKIIQKRQEMNALRAQINPHFLYNSLSLINWSALQSGQDDISRITLALSTYYRTSLNKGKNTLPIREEIDNVKSYLQIQQIMHDNNFDIMIEVEEAIWEKETINLILQPLVENAIMHGLDVKENGESKIIKILGYKKEGLIYLKVEDNGVGMDEETSQKIISHKTSGYGLRNVNERIKLQYGDEYGLLVTSTLGIGTMITIIIPAVGD